MKNILKMDRKCTFQMAESVSELHAFLYSKNIEKEWRKKQKN